MDPGSLRRANAMLVLFSALHLLLCVLLIRAAGAAGLVLADATNMVLRIAYSLW